MQQRTDSSTPGSWRVALGAAIALAVGITLLPESEKELRLQPREATALSPQAFIASSAKPFAAQIDDAIAAMAEGMKRSAINVAAEQDFITMMIPHHQSAINMAKAVLLTSTDMEMKNLAQGIIIEQENEIRFMQAWLQRNEAQRSNDSNPSN
jgi:uncharacterized protein (DUF305 family)